MRNWHRRLSIFIGIFMLIIAVSGTALQFEMMRGGPQPIKPSSTPPEHNDVELQTMLSTSLRGLHHSSDGAILGINMRLNGTNSSTEFIVADPAIRKVQVDAQTGKIFGDESAGKNKFDLHLFLLELHRGSMAGTIGTWISITCGVVLAILSVTGFILYLQMYLRRRGNKPGFLW